MDVSGLRVAAAARSGGAREIKSLMGVAQLLISAAGRRSSMVTRHIHGDWGVLLISHTRLPCPLPFCGVPIHPPSTAHVQILYLAIFLSHLLPWPPQPRGARTCPMQNHGSYNILTPGHPISSRHHTGDPDSGDSPRFLPFPLAALLLAAAAAWEPQISYAVQ